MEAVDFERIDKAYLYFDKTLIRRTKNLRLVPNLPDRTGGKLSYGEWCHVIGIFQALLYMNLSRKTDNMILDVGCGSGIIGIASEPFIEKKGRYIGLDVNEKDINFCKNHYPDESFLFKHLCTFNQAYAPEQRQCGRQWDIPDKSIDMLTALSVWTHLNEKDAVFYFKEIGRVLKPGGKAIVTFFLLDKTYYDSLEIRSDKPGRYHNTNQTKWIFDNPCSQSGMWFNPKWVKMTEDAVAITERGIDTLISNTGLNICDIHTGNWKEVPGIFFQDVLVFSKVA